ncbi:MAG: tRNA epoxyqueuosine(34) reductase QueG [Muribaculaceae bacterium]|nr:tRNA epoxyqueuosine(34) reductase QueG [Muribaculaceae bacterium]
MDLNSCLSQLDLPWAACRLTGPIEPYADAQFRNWLTEGRNASMGYMANYPDLRRDPRLLLEGAKTLIAVAFPYYTDEHIGLPVALYARGRDYHEVVRERLMAVASTLPGQWRVCVDSAPLRERYWAQRAGLGAIGRNNQLYVPGFGSYCFLGFILSTEEFDFEPKPRLENPCGDCRRCIDACPGQCLGEDYRALDARSCQSYLTIEHRGELPGRVSSLAGCDICQRVCPLNRDARPTAIADFHPTEEFARLTPADLPAMTPSRFRALFRHSALNRLRLPQLLRNLTAYSEKTVN